jgi:hypothetical protein
MIGRRRLIFSCQTDQDRRSAGSVPARAPLLGDDSGQRRAGLDRTLRWNGEAKTHRMLVISRRIPEATSNHIDEKRLNRANR